MKRQYLKEIINKAISVTPTVKSFSTSEEGEDCFEIGTHRFWYPLDNRVAHAVLASEMIREVESVIGKFRSDKYGGAKIYDGTREGIFVGDCDSRDLNTIAACAEALSDEK